MLVTEVESKEVLKHLDRRLDKN